MIDQFLDAAKSMVYMYDISFKVKMKRVHFACLISYFLEETLTELNKVKVMIVKVSPFFWSEVDKTECTQGKVKLFPEKEKELQEAEKTDTNNDKLVVTKRSKERKARVERIVAKSGKKTTSKNIPSKCRLRDETQSDKAEG